MRRLVSGLTLSLASAIATAQNFDNVVIETIAVADGVHMLKGAGGNIGVSVGPDGVLLIDDQYAPLGDKIRAAVAQLGKGEIRFVVNTHWHGDHTGDNERFGEEGAVIVAHDNVRQRMGVEQFIAAFDRKVPPSPRRALPVVTFAESVTFHLNDQTIQVFHTPSAHTDGDAMIYFREANVLHTGDVFWNGMYPFIDGSSGGSFDGTIAAVERALAVAGPATKIIPGHGALADRARLVDYLAMLREVRAKIAPLVESGTSREDTIAAKPTAAFDEAWGKGFLDPARFTGLVVDLLAARR